MTNYQLAMRAEDDNNVRGSSKALWRRYIPARYVYAVISTLGTTLYSICRSSQTIAITAMVKRNTTVTESGNVTYTGVCALEDVHYDNNQYSPKVTTGEFDWDAITQSALLSSMGYGMLISTLVGARVAEIWTPKHTYTISILGTGIIYLLVPVLARWNVIVLIVSQAFSGLFLGPMIPAASVLSASWIPPQERQQLGGIMSIASNLGSIMSSIVTGLIVEDLGWEYVFYIYASLNLSWLFLWIFFVYDSPDKHPRISEEERIYIMESTKKDERQAARKLPWKEILVSVPFWAHIIMSIPMEWMIVTLGMSMPTYFANILHYSTSQMGYYTAISSVATWLSSTVCGILSQWVRRKKYLGHLITYHVFNGIATVGSAILVLCLTLVHCNGIATIALYSLSMATSSAYIGGSQFNAMDIAINYAGTLSGLSMMLMAVMGIIATTVQGVLINNKMESLAAWNNVFYVIAVMNIIPFIIFLIFGSVEEQPWNRSQPEEKDDTSKSKSSTVEVDDVQ